MPNINLIQEQRLAIKREEGKARAFFFAFAGTAALSVMAIGFFLFMTEAAHSEESQLKAQAQKIEPLVKEMEGVQTQVGEMKPKVTILDDARKLTDKWGHLFDELSTKTPSETWLTAIRGAQQDAKSPILVTFSGITTRQELIGEFMTNLQQNEDLGTVAFKYSQEKPVQYGSQLDFQVEAPFAGTEGKEKTVKNEEDKDKS